MLSPLQSYHRIIHLSHSVKQEDFTQEVQNLFIYNEKKPRTVNSPYKHFNSQECHNSKFNKNSKLRFIKY